MDAYALNKVEFAYDSLDEAFPKVDPGHEPLGSTALFQIRAAKTMTKTGLYLPAETQETERWNTQVAKVIAIGPLAFHNRSTGAPWPEGAWYHPGDYVRVPKYGGDRWSVKLPGTEDEIVFVLLNEMDVKARVTGDPTKIKAFI